MTYVDNTSTTKCSSSCYVCHFFVSFTNYLSIIYKRKWMTNIYIRHGEDFQLLGVYHKAISIMKNV